MGIGGDHDRVTSREFSEFETNFDRKSDTVTVNPAATSLQRVFVLRKASKFIYICACNEILVFQLLATRALAHKRSSCRIYRSTGKLVNSLPYTVSKNTSDFRVKFLATFRRVPDSILISPTTRSLRYIFRCYAFKCISSISDIQRRTGK